MVRSDHDCIGGHAEQRVEVDKPGRRPDNGEGLIDAPRRSVELSMVPSLPER